MSLEEQRKKLRKMEIDYNILKLETRILELDEEKVKIRESIETLTAEKNSLDE